MTETPHSPALQTFLLRRHWPHTDSVSADVVRIWALRVYGGRPDWEAELALDLATLRPRGKGGLPSGPEGISRGQMRDWMSGKKLFPPWVAAGLPRLPDLAHERRQRELEDAERKLRHLRHDFSNDAAQARMLLAEEYARHVPAIERDPTPKPPPPRARSRRQGQPEVSADDVERADDSGHAAARLDMGLVDPVEGETHVRPEHPTLADAWDRGWTSCYRDEAKRLQKALVKLEASLKREKATAGKQSPKANK